MNISTELKYREAITLYSDSDLSIKDICERTGVGFSAFSSYLSKHHRELILKRHNLTEHENVKLRGSKGQTTSAHYKYKDAIAACDSVEYIEYNISQIARIFDVNCSALASQLRRHYPEIVPRREKQRKFMGITINLQYGARKWSTKAYCTAIEMLQSSDMTIEEVADACNVSHTGLREHVLAYHPQITQLRETTRVNAKGCKERGKRNGNWTICEPDENTIEKYEKAIELYRTTSMDVRKIARIVGVQIGGFRYHLRTWHPELMVQRRGYDEGVDLSQTKRYSKSTVEKYAEAIERLKTSDLPTARVAAEFGLNPEVFRMYLKEHYPELTAIRGMVKADNGKMISCRIRRNILKPCVSTYVKANYPELLYRNTERKKYKGTKVAADKYASAIECMRSTSDSIKSVADKFGLNEYSFRKYLHKHAQDVLAFRRIKLKTDSCN